MASTSKPPCHPGRYHGAMVRAWSTMATSSDAASMHRRHVEIEQPPAMAPQQSTINLALLLFRFRGGRGRQRAADCHLDSPNMTVSPSIIS